MKLYYDLHIHSALSPCGDDDMTPNNIINMSVLKGLDVIAITDHNSSKNVRACCKCGSEAGIIVIPGMEIETSEEVHLVALFDSIDASEELDKIISGFMPQIKNREDIFGNQYVMNSNDEIVESLPHLLSTACSLTINEACSVVRNLGGVVIPAHVDKTSYSIISNLGFIPDETNFSTLEIKFPKQMDLFLKSHNLIQYKTIHNSDAHFLWDISEKEHFINVKTPTAAEIIDHLKQK